MQNERKLAAILSADVAGYSRLMGDDEQATLATLTEYRIVMREQIAAHHGRVVNAPGDALLAEFPSAVEAVESAVEIQNALSQRNDKLAEDRRMRVRIGINLGDVIEQDNALYGDGVNVAARLEAMCEPGGVCVSGTIFDQVEDKTSVGFQFGGQHHVKNITKPVRAYHAQLAHVKSPGIRLDARKKKFLIGWTAFALITCLGLWMFNDPRETTWTEQEALLAMPSGPVVAVLPFTNMSGDPEQDYFSDGLTEDIITELSRFREIHVLARNTTFQYKGQSVDIPALTRELGAQYVLEGSVRQAGDRVRITAQLIDGSNGVHLWAERFDRDYEDVFKIQDEVAHLIVGTVASGYGGSIQSAEVRKSNSKSVDQMEAYELILKTRANLYSQARYDQGIEWLERAIDIAPDYARARSEYAWFRLLGWIFRFDPSPVPPAQILDNAIRAIQLDPSDPYGHRTAAFGYFFGKRLGEFEREADKALALAPYNAEIFAQIGMLYTFIGQWEKGVALVTKANTINPISAQGWYHSALHYDFYRKHEYQEALEAVSLHPSPALCETQYKFVSAYGQLLQPEKARPHWENCKATNPDMSADFVADILRLWNFQEPFIEHYMEGFEKAGYPCRSTPCGLKPVATASGN